MRILHTIFHNNCLFKNKKYRKKQKITYKRFISRKFMGRKNVCDSVVFINIFIRTGVTRYVHGDGLLDFFYLQFQNI